MIDNRWRKHPRHKPKEDGWYTCTVRTGDEPDEICVMDLYYVVWKDAFFDKRRTDVFDGYKCYKPSRAAIEDNRVYSDVLCDRTLGVVAWKKVCKPYIGLWKRIRRK